MESPFRDAIPEDTRLIETLGWSPEGGYRHLALHLARLEQSAMRLGFPFDLAACRAALGHDGEEPQRVRLTLDARGIIEVTRSALPSSPALWRVALHPQRLDPDDPWLGVKTTQRALYDKARQDLPKGIDEWLFLNTRDEFCEGTITNLFVIREDGERVTPPLSSGVLPGVLRASLLIDGWKEAVLCRDDLAKAREIYMGNAVRGLIRAELAPFA